MYMQAQSFNITLPQELVRKADEVAQREYRNRSELIREALWLYLKEKEEWDKMFRYGQRKAKKLGIKSAKEVDRIVADFRHGK